MVITSRPIPRTEYPVSLIHIERKSRGTVSNQRTQLSSVGYGVSAHNVCVLPHCGLRLRAGRGDCTREVP